ncbi:hypothetical protein IFM89_014272 [Coptis chinensis]|uniref:Uncharacterized protein n=1 Tax=Coptis chinensis TaxID=261450 RepID=A0A835LM53_9MAGN|nr:hypothetical protein IFM89_014272 [Coptis chinensis]
MAVISNSLLVCFNGQNLVSINKAPKPIIQIHVFGKTKKTHSQVIIIRCTNNNNNSKQCLKTCKNCKTQFDPSLNNPNACRFHTSHFGGETRRKFESVYSGGTMNTPDAGKVFQYWHCCGSEDPFDIGCTAAPHLSYDD